MPKRGIITWTCKRLGFGHVAGFGRIRPLWFWWLDALRLFCGIVWRRPDGRCKWYQVIGVRDAWAVAFMGMKHNLTPRRVRDNSKPVDSDCQRHDGG